MRRLACLTAIVGGVLGSPNIGLAQRIATPLLQVSHDGADALGRERPSFDTPPRARGPIALRGLLVGAVVGGVVGYYAHRHEEYGGAVGGPILGAVIGAPLGMLVFLLATPL